MELFLKQFSILISGEFQRRPSGGCFCQSVSVSVCLHPSLQASIHGCGCGAAPSIPSCARRSAGIQPRSDSDGGWHWRALTPHSRCLAWDTRVVWRKLKIKRWGPGCGQPSRASAVRGGGRGGGGSISSAFCITRIKVSQNCCQSRARATQGTWCAAKELFLRGLITCRSGGAERCSSIAPTDSGGRFSWPHPDASSSRASGLLEKFSIKTFRGSIWFPWKCQHVFISFCQAN